MRIFIELPTWLGDAVMATPAIESIAANYKEAKITFFGSFVACELFKVHPNCETTVVDDSKKRGNRFLNLAKIALNLGDFDIAVSFRSSFASSFLLFWLKAKRKFKFKKQNLNLHQVLKYLNFAKNSLALKEITDELKLHFTPFKFDKKILALNPGASYGSAKRWYPEYFAEVALRFKDEFEIVIFGSNAELKICEQIEKILASNGVKCKNLAGKTDIKELCEKIGGIKKSAGIFITNDSGPMHIAAAFKVPTVVLFGPTKFDETRPWKNENAKILHLNLSCMPCMKRTCPIKTHECMKNLTPDFVMEEINKFSQTHLSKKSSQKLL
ncbi:lipopolysaccharide heptosyltransferase II [Campylobacter sp.]|uniref:lipopolysaccharide heptosyltransferase II n=1 Tax=Campylobacter sp. TaxID=205 RepID=UPI0026FF6286|nr:lipopolysaccharide heptosyltransferase II [Campylobacter sp.]